MSRPASLTVAVVVPALLALAACSKPAAPPAAEATPPAAEAPAAAPVAEANVFRFTIGTLPAFAMRDATFTFPNDNKTVAINKTAEDVAKLLTDAGLSATELSLSVQPLLVQAGDRVLLFDTGTGAGKLAADLKEAGIEAASVTDIFISHSHGDHIGGLVGEGGAAVYPNATVHLSAPEWTFLQGQKEQAAVVAAITPKVDAFKPGSELVPGVVKAVEIKGHTPGHSAYLIGSGTDTLLYTGDTMHHSIVSVQQPDWTIQFDGDAPLAQASRKETLASAAASGQRIYAVHFPYPGIGKIEKRGEGFVWVPEQ